MNGKAESRKTEERGRGSHAGLPYARRSSAFRSKFHARRPAITLIELLISIAIISILATLLLGVGAVAAEVARESRTKALVARLHTLVMERYDSYRNRRVELRDYTVDAAHRARLLTGGGIATAAITDNDPRFAAITRLVGLRELMKLEMPDRWGDIVGWNDLPGAPTPPGGVPIPAGTLPPVSVALATQRLWVLDSLPTLTKVYLREYQRLVAAGVSSETARENQGAEMLYLLVMNGTADGEARGLFRESDVDDTDGDGALEFVDGWGNPISFIRWAPGFDSDAQQSNDSLIRTVNNDGLDGTTNALLDDHDPYDLFRIDNANLSSFTPGDGYVGARSWRLMPLIVSAGGDEEFGLQLDEDRVTLVDPYMDYDRSTGNGSQGLGYRTDREAYPDTKQEQILALPEHEAYADNVHNHQIGSLSNK